MLFLTSDRPDNLHFAWNASAIECVNDGHHVIFSHLRHNEASSFIKSHFFILLIFDFIRVCLDLDKKPRKFAEFWMFKYGLIKGLVLMCKIWIRSFIKVLSCMTGCFGQPDEAACQFICQWELGQTNEKYLKLLTCMGENGCLTMQPDGVCLSSARYSSNIVNLVDKKYSFDIHYR